MYASIRSLHISDLYNGGEVQMLPYQIGIHCMGFLVCNKLADNGDYLSV